MYLANSQAPFYGSGTVTLEIPGGDEGTAQTISAMRQFVYEGVRDVDVNRAAVAIVQSVPAHRPEQEAKAIYDWVLSNIRFTPDISSAETLRTAAEILKVRAGDCDCINGVLLPTLFSSVGLDTRLVTVAADDSRPDIFSHIYPEVKVNGQWTPADAAAEHASWGKEPGHVYRKRIWDIEKDSYTDLKGYRFLGQDDGSSNGFDWSALTSAISAGGVAAAQVAKAVNQPSVPIYGLPGTNVSTLYTTPGVTGVASAAGGATATATVSTSGSLVVGGGLLLLLGVLLFMRH